ncbi:unnamed protein product [Triticum turgidum subsp. durum]|uniref:MATH domain-containing protein n=1 Tax=Triticum turgidum subsp. durum TaxID=4567 RepID=A0A9R1QPX4_TRITD|nr:unnamed protein product [Triticum turgidum subsp. durum]
MGATASRSAEPTTCVVPVLEYFKLVRSPQPQHVQTILFRGLFWDVNVRPTRFVDGLADKLVVSLRVDLSLRHHLESALGNHISIEILDETREHTVFREDTIKGMMQQEVHQSSCLYVNRRELEASSCVFDDRFTIRCTLKKTQQGTKRRSLLGSLSKSNAILETPQVAMAGAHTLTMCGISELRVVLRNGECIYSTQFTVGGCTWYLKFCPRWHTWAFLRLFRASIGDETPPTTADFSFELEGEVNFKSKKMRHTFSDADPKHLLFHYQPIVPATHDDRLVVRLYLAVIMAEDTPPVVPMCTESVFTPLLTAMHD